MCQVMMSDTAVSTASMSFRPLPVMTQTTVSWGWTLFSFSYMTALAYLGALATYQISTWIAG